MVPPIFTVFRIRREGIRKNGLFRVIRDAARGSESGTRGVRRRIPPSRLSLDGRARGYFSSLPLFEYDYAHYITAAAEMQEDFVVFFRNYLWFLLDRIENRCYNKAT